LIKSQVTIEIGLKQRTRKGKAFGETKSSYEIILLQNSKTPKLLPKIKKKCLAKNISIV